MGFSSPELLDPCRRISECYQNLAQFKLAEHFLERAMKIGEGNEQVVAQLHDQFSILYRRQGKWQESLDSSNKALRLAKKQLGSSHIQLAQILNGQAHIHLEIGNPEEAALSAAEALRVAELQSAPAFEHKSNSLFLLGRAKAMHNSKEEALQCFTG